jgi:hypothetical protein
LQELLDIGKMNLSKYISTQHPTLDPTTPWFEFLSYCEVCYSLGVKDQPNIGRFMKYRNYLNKIGVI